MVASSVAYINYYLTSPEPDKGRITGEELIGSPVAKDEGRLSEPPRVAWRLWGRPRMAKTPSIRLRKYAVLRCRDDGRPVSHQPFQELDRVI